jgi:hypothetical protein
MLLIILFRIYLILFCFKILKEAHANTCYKHFIYFVTEFNLLRKEEMEPLVSLNNLILLKCIYLFYIQQN